MRRSTNLLVAVTAAVITFAALNFTFGPKQFAWRGHHRHAYGSFNERHPCDDDTKTLKDKDAAAPDQDASHNDF